MKLIGRSQICSLIKGQLVTMDDSKITGYPVCVAGINVVALMVEMFGLGDAGIHTEGEMVVESFHAGQSH